MTLTPAADPGYDAGDAAPLAAYMPPRDRDQLAADLAHTRAELAAALAELALANAAVDDLAGELHIRAAANRAIDTDPTAADAELTAALAAVCEHHTGDGCQVCDDTAAILRLRGLDDPLADLTLMRTAYPAWLARVRADWQRLAHTAAHRLEVRA